MGGLIFVIGMIICLVTSCIFKKSAIDMCNQEWSRRSTFYLVETVIIVVGILFEYSLIRLTITLVIYVANITM